MQSAPLQLEFFRPYTGRGDTVAPPCYFMVNPCLTSSHYFDTPMDLSWLIVLGAMLAAFGLPFLFWGMVKIMQGLTQTRSDLKNSASTMQHSLDTQSSNVQDVLSSQERLIERIQHLEAIVTSEAWDTMAKEKQERIAEEVLQLQDDSAPDEERTARMARNIERG